MTLIADLAEASRAVSATSKRIAKISELARCLRALDQDEIAIAVHYLSGELTQGKIGIPFASLHAAAGQPPAAEPTLTIKQLDELLTNYADLRGAGSATKRANLIAGLFEQASANEREFLFRLLIGELRQGALGGVMLEAIAAAAGIAPADVRRAAMYAKDLGVLAEVAITEGAQALSRFDLVLMSPVAPMLAQTAVDVAEAIDTLGTAIFEWKMDGARIQAHKRDQEVRIYTRSLNDVTAAIPEIEAAVRELPVKDVILDGEAISFTASGRPHSFQTTMRRFGRKLNVAAMQAELPIQAFFFDCLFLDSESLAQRSTAERIEKLKHFVPAAMQMPRLITSDTAEAQAFYEQAIASGHEGIMAKSLEVPYEAGNRGAGWLKIKRAHTLDLVVLAAEWGHGRRTGKLSNLHLGALDPATGEYVMLGKTFKGLTDEMLAWQTQEFLAREIERDRMTVYVKPELVVEIAFSDLQISSRYPGGLALRLARVKRYRPDKTASDADTMESVRLIARAQEGVTE
jgi:DNA ligase-1